MFGIGWMRIQGDKNGEVLKRRAPPLSYTTDKIIGGTEIHYYPQKITFLCYLFSLS